jgi:beta-galactosidase
MSQKALFNDNWKFTKMPVHSSLEEVLEGEVTFSPVSLPHDWLIYNTNDLYETGDGWYKKSLFLEESQEINNLLTRKTTARSSLSHYLYKPDTKFSLYFEGVYMDSYVYVNGTLAGNWKYGYSSFEYNITPFLTLGENEILVQVCHESPNSRWYSGAGIYRNVWLKASNTSHLVTDGIYLSTKQLGTDWEVTIDAEISLTSNSEPANYALRYSIIDVKGNIASEKNIGVNAASDGAIYTSSTALIVKEPEIWDLSSPNLYSLKTELLFCNTIIDTENLTFGFSTKEFDTEKGFFLNGKHLKINGVCEHHDLGCLGAAVNKAALRRKILLLKEMGVNGIRTSHNMPAVELMELADTMGMLIVSEGFDMWERSKTTYDYARFFPEWSERDVASWVRRDRNHPSLILWSIGNEIYDTHADDRGQEVTRYLKEQVEKHDYRGNAPATIGSNFMPWENARKCADILKYAGYNYAEKYYEEHHKEHPDWFIYGSETSSTVQSRSIYHFPLSQAILNDDDEQCSCLGNSTTSWGAKNTEYAITADRDAKFSFGQFIWTGFDYIGEPTPYSTKNSYFGQIDTAGFKKDTFYIYQAEWTDYRTNPMVHIFPYWDFSEGQLIDVRVCSNAPSIELYLNDVSQGIYHIDHVNGKDLLGHFKIPYTKGVLRAVAYDKNGTVIAEDKKTSFTDTVSLQTNWDKNEISANAADLIFLEISAVDNDGNFVYNAKNRIQVSVEGAGVLAGLDNGDSTDYDQYKGTSRRLFGGKLLAVIQSTFKEGNITVTIESEGLKAKTITFTSLPVSDKELLEGVSEPLPLLKNQEEAIKEIPIRKLEILAPKGTLLSAECTSIPLQLKIHPENATYKDISWRLTTVTGSDTSIASLELPDKSHPESVQLTALGDGFGYIRCQAMNGGSKVNLYSQLEFNIDGVGIANVNPYSFVAGSNYSSGSSNLTNGNERGVATTREELSIITFERLDFGAYGSRELTLPIFATDQGIFDISIWSGIPDENNARLITTVAYDLPQIWGLFQEKTYILPELLRGIQTISFSFKHPLHLKGFTFTEARKAFDRLELLNRDSIYGDSFTLGSEAIERIGNNVSIEFLDMDFGDIGSSRLTLCGHSPLDKNTIHIHFTDDNGDYTELVEFSYSENYCEREYIIKPVIGKKKVTFVFLPGSNFDFKWFQFSEINDN